MHFALKNYGIVSIFLVVLFQAGSYVFNQNWFKLKFQIFLLSLWTDYCCLETVSLNQRSLKCLLVVYIVRIVLYKGYFFFLFIFSSFSPRRDLNNFIIRFFLSIYSYPFFGDYIIRQCYKIVINELFEGKRSECKILVAK